MSAATPRVPFDADLPSGTVVPMPTLPRRRAPDAPPYVGSVTVGQRGVFGPIDLEMEVNAPQLFLGPYVMDVTAVAQLIRLLTVARALLLAPPPAPKPTPTRTSPPATSRPRRPPPLPESGRGITGFDLDLARNTFGVAAAGCPWEGETLP